MTNIIFIVVFYFLLLDSIVANIIAWTDWDRWYYRTFHLISRYFPITRGWTTYYLILVLWLGVVMFSTGLL